MRFFVIYKNTTAVVMPSGVSVEELRRYRRIRAIASRGPIYGFPIVLVIWLWMAWPNVAPEVDLLPFYTRVAMMALALIFTPILHEFLHLLAVPAKIFRSDTFFITRLDGLRSGFAVRPGGAVTREQYIWTSLLPVLTLTVVPFCLLAFGFKLPFAAGFVAACNFGLSLTDMIQAVVAFNSMKYREVITPPPLLLPVATSSN